MRLFVFALIAAFALSVPAESFAQAKLPEFSLEYDSMQRDRSNLALSFDQAFGAIKGPNLSDRVKLQYQIELLDKLTARQASLERISETYAKLGIPFKAPAPSRGYCEQLPPNALCMKYYPDIFPDLVGERKAAFEAKMPKMEIDRKTGQPAPKNDAPKEPEKPQPGYYWTDIQCANGNCRAVLEDANGSGARTRVRAGATLADGSQVRTISADGVTVMKKGELLALEPAPLSGIERAATQEGQASSSQMAPGLSSAASGQRTGLPPRPGAAQPVEAPSRDQALLPAAQSIGGGDSAQPTLGPSGLF